MTPVVPILQMNVDEVSAFFLNLMKRLLQMEAGGGKPGRLWAGKKQPAGRIDDGFTLIVDDKLCFWKIEYSLQAPSTANLILPRDLYRGRGTGGEGIANKLRLVRLAFCFSNF